PQSTYMFKHALIQDAAYQSLLKSTRQHYHQRIAQVLEAQFAETAAAQPELLAHHYTEASLIEQAVTYWQRAGQTALQRSAYQEAITHVTRGLALLQDGPETAEVRVLALHLQATLGAALIATQGYAAPDVAQAYTRAYALCQQVGEAPQLGSVLRGLRLFYVVRAEFRTAQTLEEQLFEHAHCQGDPAALAVAHSLRSETLFFEGRFPEARTHAETGVALAAQQQAHAQLELVSRARLSLILWMLGAADQALAYSHTALVRARALNHPLTLAGVLGYTALLHPLRPAPP